MREFQKTIENILYFEHGKMVEESNATELYQSISKAAMRVCREKWNNQGLEKRKRAAYFSTEFLIGRMFENNLFNLGLWEETEELFRLHGVDKKRLEEIEDPALGNGELGRLAACFLDSAATHGIYLDGYGIRYRYGLLKQYFENGFQKEMEDNWLSYGDPWSVRKEKEKIKIKFENQEVYAVPYDMPVIGYGAKTINTLRLWQAEPVHEFSYELFNQNKFDLAFKEKNDAEMITTLLYPNDDTDEGKKLRIKQQYFFTSASLQTMLKHFKQQYGKAFGGFSDVYAIQLNDTHPVVAIPEFLRLFVEQEGLTFGEAFTIARKTFSYTNHTVMAEALEKGNVKLYKQVIPHVYDYIQLLDKHLEKELKEKGLKKDARKPYRIIEKDIIHMARMAAYVSRYTNGVANIHTKILKKDVLKEWYQLYPERFQNKTNGITQRRWLALANPELAGFITEKIGDSWITDLTQLQRLRAWEKEDTAILEFDRIKRTKKQQLADYILKNEGISIDPEFIYDVQIKRLHEYKRQLLHAFAILDTYFGLRDGRITEFTPTVYLFGAKAAPGYKRAKGIIKFIYEIGQLIEKDEHIAKLIKVVFVTNYNISYAEKIIPATDVSEQISTAGTEASGTGNMKLMLNGAVTLGTLDGANVEIVAQAGEENNYIFGAQVEEIKELKASYHPKSIYGKEKRIKAVLDMLVNGILDDGGTGIFEELYSSILEGASWHAPDPYFILEDFYAYCDAKLLVNHDYQNTLDFRKKCFCNMCAAGIFSSDRTILEYAKNIWELEQRLESI